MSLHSYIYTRNIHKVRLPQLTHFPSLHSPLLAFLPLTFSITVLCLPSPSPKIFPSSPSTPSTIYLTYLTYTYRPPTHLPTYLQPLLYSILLRYIQCSVLRVSLGHGLGLGLRFSLGLGLSIHVSLSLGLGHGLSVEGQKGRKVESRS